MITANLLEKVKENLRPDTSIIKDVTRFTEELNSRLRSAGIKASIVPGGSVAKGTFLRGDFDVDLFARFDISYKDKDISKILSGPLNVYSPEILHGSRDYFQIRKDEISYEIVPVLDVKDPAATPNVTDMSPMHVDWVKKHLKAGGADEIRLVKKFCKAAGVYGAESYIRGFSGHVIDILVIHYGSFLGFLEASQKWKAPVVIDTEKHYANTRDVLFSMNRSKIEGPLIVVDPILKSRNAASAISFEKFSLFKKKAGSFLKNPSEEFFIEEKIGRTTLAKKFKKNLYIAEYEAPQGKKDVVGSKILKAFKMIKAGLAGAGFDIKDAGWTWNGKQHALLWFVFKEDMLPESRIVGGPPADMADFASQFRAKYTDAYVKEGRLFARIKVERRAALDNIRSISLGGPAGDKVRLKDADKIN